MKTIYLSKGQFALVNDDDFEFLNQYSWHVLEGKHTYYAVRAQRIGKCSEGKQLSILMHRFILNAPKGMEADHIDGNGLNNQRCNLRIATISQNRMNHIRKNPNSTSRFKGVSWNSNYKKWVATIQLNKKPIWLGSHIKEEDAAKAYDRAAIEHFKEFASPNFS